MESTHSALWGRTFRVVSIDGEPTAAPRPELRFGADGILSGSATINRISGPWREPGAQGPSLELGPLISTLMAGEPGAMRQEQRLLAVVAGPLSVAPDDGGITLARQDGSGRLALVEVRMSRVAGTVAYRPRIALAPDAVTIVTVGDVARADGPVEVLATCTVAGGQVPIAFDCEFRRDDVDPSARLAVSARIEQGGRLAWITDTVVLVDPEGAEGVELVVVQVH